MNPTPDHNLETPPGPPSWQLSTGLNTTNDSESSHREELHQLRVAKAQAELTEASVRVQIAEQNLEEAKHDKLASQRMNLPHRELPLKIYNDGLTWIAIYECPEGDPLVGRGESPSIALIDFDHQWLGSK